MGRANIRGIREWHGINLFYEADDGKVALRAFFGTYEVKVAGHEMQTVELLERSPREIEVKRKKVSQ